MIRGALFGAVGGVVATAAMDLLWHRRYRQAGGDESFVHWELSAGVTGFGSDAPAPARVGKYIADAVGIELADSSAAATNNVVHWMTGVGWGKVAGAAASVSAVPPIAVGVATGVTAWATSYALLGRLGIYEPITEYDTATLWKDLSAHLVFGVTLGAVLRAAARSSR